MLNDELNDEHKVISDVKYIASVGQLALLLGDKCRTNGCSAALATVSHSFCGLCVKLEWYCSVRHRGIWYSSPFYAAGLAVNYILESALFLSGGQVNQFKRFCKFVNLGKVSATSFNENQRFYVATAVEQEFSELRDSVVDKCRARGEKVIVCGDGRMDSPGFCATKGSYTMMDYASKQLITMECGDKREVQSSHF
eukprot:Seg1070.15 transcript_id=Seg1070.15/GoldUCD/mRNA.D3Y31 product="hypothetical protein" protein_id=Seg1070.15/GoldUCD/D3Y31